MKIVAFLKHKHIEEFSLASENASRLEKAFPGTSVRLCEDESTFLRELPDAEIALVWRFKQEWFDVAKNLRIVSTPAAGRDYFKVIPPENVEIMYGSFHGKIMGETAVAMILGAARGIVRNASSMTSGGEAWPREIFSRQIRTIKNSHIVILGFGAIGQHAGRLLKGFGAKITGVRRNPPECNPEWFGEGDRVVGVDKLASVLPEAEHLLCILPSGEDTYKMLDRRRLSLLPHGAYLHNIGRGSVVDEEALAEALESGTLGGAFLDVFEEEPLPAESALRRARNAFLYPHVSAVAPEYLKLYIDELIDRLKSRSPAV
jgi:D-2-hydroxyacid dehydrogenase (NADP+)